MNGFRKLLMLILCVFGIIQALNASKLYKFKVVDQDYLMLWFQNGIVDYVDDGTGPGAYGGHESGEPDNSFVVSYGDALDLAVAMEAANWKIKSSDDSNYGTSGVSPTAVFRKTRVNGMSYTGWDAINNDHGFDYTYEHFIYLKMPFAMQQDKEYTVDIPANINADSSSVTITFDIFNAPSEAVHNNLVGYMGSSRIKAADLYYFLGDGGYRDYSEFVGNDVYIYNVDSEASLKVGSVKFWMENKNETNWNLTGSDVWSIDFTGFTQNGTYRLAVEGVGCSEDFEIRDNIYHDPYKVSVLGYFYMRIGQDNLDMTPVPRRPLFIQDQDPVNCKIYITDMDPYHPDWESFASGDKWDAPSSWVPYIKNGNPTNPNAIGGHSDALDWDRHLGHVINIYDLCLAYILSDAALDDDDLRIAESGNGIPDILDEARNEVDFWLNLRFNSGYSHGLTNPDDNNNLYQADNTAMAAWANALNSAMLAYCFQLAGLNELKQIYQDSSVVAYNYANSLADPMLNTQVEGIRGIDFKMMTAAFLYNLTGDTQYEDIVNSESMVSGTSSPIYQQGSYNQLWGTAAYLLTKRPVHYPELRANMKASIIARAKSKEADYVSKRPSRRGYSTEQAWWQTNQDMPRTVLAHAVSDNATDQVAFMDALLLEADWGLGRNPLNMIQMTTATTELANKRSIENCYTSGRDDGTPGLHPGHTPFLNTEGWGGNMVGSNPSKVLQKFYPDYNSWPHASKYINTRRIWAHSEFTPRSTMRGKMLIYAYLYSLSKNGGSIIPVLIADAGPDQQIVDQDENGKEIVQLDGSASYSSDSEITHFSWILNDSVIATGMTASVELDTGRYEIILNIENTNEETAADTVIILILSQISGQYPDYDFETEDQLSDWIFQNWDQGGEPTAIISSEKARHGLYSVKISGNFTVNSQIALKRTGSLADNVETIVYYVWIPQAMIDSANAAAQVDPTKAGGIQNYFLHSNWNWKDQWYSIKELQGNAWNRISFKIPEDVVNSEILESGMVCTMQNAAYGEGYIYVDDITYEVPAEPADYDFETGEQFDDWYAENFKANVSGGVPIASQSSEIVHGGAFSFKIAANFIAGSEHSLRQNNDLEADVISMTYHVWVPQVLVDSALAVYERDTSRVGGIQVYLMHNGWQWVSQWVSLKDLVGDGWSKVELEIPENVDNALVQAFGISFQMLDVSPGEIAIYIDDIYFNRDDTQTAVYDGAAGLAEIPTDYKLFHNFPNPFNPQTEIRYHVPQKSHVRVEVYDINGRHVRTLIDKQQNAGRYRLTFDGQGLASGVYFYSLCAGSFRDVKKMILLK